MGTDMIIRTLYVIASTEPDFAVGKAAAAGLAARAEPAELDVFLDEGWAADIEPSPDRRGGQTTTHHLPTDHARQLVAHTLNELLDSAARTPQLPRGRPLPPRQRPRPRRRGVRHRRAQRSRIQLRVHGLGHPGRGLPPTRSWSATNNDAVGLVDPAGNGPAAATVAFRTRG